MDIKKLDKQYIASSYNRQDVAFVKGKGSYLIDENGKKYIDFGCGIGVNGLGHSNKKILKAVKGQLNKITHTSNLYYSEPQTKLAEKLCKISGLKKVFFANSGAEANECAIKCARKYSFDKYGENRNEIITLVNSFHGRTITTLSATGQDVFHTIFMPFTQGFSYVEANNLSSLESAITNKTCAVMLELVQGEGGVIALDKEYIAGLVKICQEKDILVIVDEVQTGNGRTGTYFAFEQYGFLPDILTTAKGLGNGLPIGACLLGEKLKDTLTYSSHGSTFGGNPVCCAGALATIEQIDDKLLEKVRQNSEKIFKTLSSFKKVKGVTGLGYMIGIEVEDAKSVLNACLEKGLVVLTAKTKIRLLIPLNILDADLNKGLSILKEILD